MEIGGIGRVRQTILLAWLVIAVVVIGAAALLAFVGMGFLVSILFALLVGVLIGLGHYYVWGRTMEHDTGAGPRAIEYNPITGRAVGPHDSLILPPSAEGEVTEASRESFPASDPPGWVGRSRPDRS